MKNADKRGVELFNLKNDTNEKTNLANKKPGRLMDLQARLAMFAKQSVPPKVKTRPKGFVAPKVRSEKDLLTTRRFACAGSSPP